MSHDQPAYARVPGIRVYGMMCNAAGRNRRESPQSLSGESLWPPIGWVEKKSGPSLATAKSTSNQGHAGLNA